MRGSSHTMSLEQRVLETNPLTECFGNARTIRNDNSSRFGKWISINFDAETSKVRGAKLSAFLLEKVRVVRQTEGERNFHAFYEAQATRALDAAAVSSSVCLRGSSCGLDARRDGRRDAETLAETQRAATTILDEPIALHYALVASLAELGAVEFIGRDQACVKNSSLELARSAAHGLGVDVDLLVRALVERRVSTPGESIAVALGASAAMTNRDSLLKACYASLFDDIVRSINAALDEAATTPSVACDDISPLPEGSTRHIGILDIFGFEVFETNSFEQLLINYANEQLQSIFNNFVFELEMKEYADEGLDCCANIDFPNNLDILALLEGSPMPMTRSSTSPAQRRPSAQSIRGVLPAASTAEDRGIFATIDDESLLAAMRNADSSRTKGVIRLGERLRKVHSSDPNFICTPSQLRNARFAISHYAADVEYSLDEFVDKNIDLIPAAVIELARSTSHRIVRDAARGVGQQSSLTRRRPSLAARATLAQRFRASLSSLLDLIRATRPHFVRCLKPNDTLVADLFDRRRLSLQLRYCGILEAVRVARAGFPVRMAHAAFTRRYFSALMGRTPRCSLDDVKLLIATRPAGIVLGRSKVFMKRNAYECLEASLASRLARASIVLQAAFRRDIARRLLSAARILAKNVAFVVRRRAYRNLQAAVGIQAWFRAVAPQRGLRRARTAVCLIQRVWHRPRHAEIKHKPIGVSFTALQRAVRRKLRHKPPSQAHDANVEALTPQLARYEAEISSLRDAKLAADAAANALRAQLFAFTICQDEADDPCDAPVFPLAGLRSPNCTISCSSGRCLERSRFSTIRNVDLVFEKDEDAVSRHYNDKVTYQSWFVDFPRIFGRWHLCMRPQSP